MSRVWINLTAREQSVVEFNVLEAGTMGKQKELCQGPNSDGYMIGSEYLQNAKSFGLFLE